MSRHYSATKPVRPTGEKLSLTCRHFTVALITWLLTLSAHAVVETYEFDDELQREQYQVLVETLRCPKCQNQNISDSNAPIASDMRKAVHKLVSEGKDTDDVVNYMVSRFGEFVVYKPKLDPKTYLLWFGPALFFLIGLVVVVVYARRQRAPGSKDGLSVADQDKLKHLLNEDEK